MHETTMGAQLWTPLPATSREFNERDGRAADYLRLVRRRDGHRLAAGTPLLCSSKPAHLAVNAAAAGSAAKELAGSSATCHHGDGESGD